MRWLLVAVLVGGVGAFLYAHGVDSSVVYVVRSIVRHVGYAL